MSAQQFHRLVVAELGHIPPERDELTDARPIRHERRGHVRDAAGQCPGDRAISARAEMLANVRGCVREGQIAYIGAGSCYETASNNTIFLVLERDELKFRDVSNIDDR